jgi:cytochrome c oxidase assembly protein subunit 15
VGKTPAFVSELRFLKMNAKAQNTNDPWLHQFAVLTAIITFLLLGIGGLVTSHEAGMSVPDWPTSYGYNMFALPIKFWKGGAFFEHTHRLLASGAGFLTTILVLWLFGKNSRPFMRWSGFALLAIGIASEYLFPNRWLDGVLYSATGLTSYIASFFWPRCEWSVKWLRWLGVLTFLLVVAQGVLGGLRVTMHMDSLGIFHGVLAQFFFVLTCAIALFTSRFWCELAAKQKTFSVPRGLRSHVLFVTILIFLQLILGATMRHQHAGLAIPDFPTAYGKIWPDTGADAIAHYNTQRMDVNGENPITAFQIILQMIHRVAALAIFAGVAAAAWLSRKRLGGKNPLTKLAWFWLALIVAQILLGAWTVWSNKAADVATAHVLVGALSLVMGAFWCILAFHHSISLPEIVPATTTSDAFATIPALAANK